ncbi:uncharacterized protein CTHT_0055490 [Thermochaetoides thermophila DSM 1495]|uniref:Prolyl 4-hydroxylase alpha subunit domain-containing protein n=1 Tax=Chaetomium thermophilum (strain DSM 1495 / CBS 144.50 / IMI 039719) TaxID=759272 RepID=G0SC10_CHATD|nr:hypothetical protein CTHT_0055490 [Thermochaetoides thermophila DSM 1495]EGS18936.1 hypothetical protein CTHT_0055490 [Thermochaetoides thermophila DSM 1495]
MASKTQVAGISFGALLLGISIPYLSAITSPFTSLIGDFSVPDHAFSFPFFKSNITTKSLNVTIQPTFVCDPNHTYRTELVSLDPVIIYIHDFITKPEIDALLEVGEPRFKPSQVAKYGVLMNTNDRTSSSAGLPRDDQAVMCVMRRARNFLGTMIRDGWDDMGAPQLVRYREGEKFNHHHDWFENPQMAYDGTSRKWNRVASFFAILQDNCTGGETYFPYAKPIALPGPWGAKMWHGEVRRQKNKTEEVKPLWREHEDGGLAFRPVAGNAIFWINLHANGTGDTRTLHAGLPLDSGLKTAMNIWPKHFYLE